jgi:hypothetical protein
LLRGPQHFWAQHQRTLDLVREIQAVQEGSSQRRDGGLSHGTLRGLEVWKGSCAVMYVKPDFSYRYSLQEWIEQVAGTD